MDDTVKTCTRCGEEKPLSEFHKSRNGVHGAQSRCKVCNNLSAREWQAKNPERFEKIWRRQVWDIKRRAIKYGLTVDELTELLEENSGLCKICGRQPNQWLVVDHCHKTNVVRGALCEKCNQALGLMDDNPEYLVKAAEYLRIFQDPAPLAESG